LRRRLAGSYFLLSRLPHGARGSTADFAGDATLSLRTMREKLSLMALVLSAVVAILSALTMRDHVRLVEIVTLFASGVGTGASLVGALMRRRAGRRETA
jgi:hypothetical protein